MINYGPSGVLFFIETSQKIAGHDTYWFSHEGIFRIPSIHLADTEGFFFTHHISRYSRNGKLSYNELERSTMFNGKIHYKWSCSIAMLNYQMVI